MKRLCGAAILAAASMPAFAQQQAPIISIHLSSGEPLEYSISIGATKDTYVDIDNGFGLTEYKIAATVPDPENGAKATTVTFIPGEDASVKIYGNPEEINYLDIEGIYCDGLDISRCLNLEILNVSINNLPELDLSPFKKLSAIFASQNPFNVKPILIGPDHPELVILEMMQIERIDTSLNLSDYPKLKSFEAFGTKDLRVCDPTGCPDLMLLSLDCTNVSTLDVSKNPELIVLNISQTKILDIDLSHNQKLRQFFCSHSGVFNEQYKMETIDVSANTDLKALFCSGNLLKSIDISANTNLVDLFADENYLTDIDLSNNPDLMNVVIDENCMDFATLPLPIPQYTYYLYDQRPLPFDRCYEVNTRLDLSSRLNRANSTTTAALYADDVELGPEYYSYENGIITLKKETTDSLHFEFRNDLFPEYGLRTTNFRVKTSEDFAKDNAIITFRMKPTTQNEVAMSVGILGASPENPKRFAVDFGDGVPVDFVATTQDVPDVPNVTGTKKKIGAMQVLLPENTDMYAFAIDNVPLSTIDVTQATTLHMLSITNCDIPSIDLGNNKWLEMLNLSGNSLKELNLDVTDYRKVKNDLRFIYANDNEIETYIHETVINPYVLEMANNRLTEMNLANSYFIQHLNLAGNLLTYVNLYDCLELTYLDVSDNLLDQQEVPAYVNLDYLNLSGNNIPLTKLVVPGNITDYKYAPQRPWNLPDKGPAASLPEQWLDIDGAKTEFRWYKVADDTPLTAEECIPSGNYGFKFPDVEVGSVYCKFTHPLFPDFKGEDSYVTSHMQVAEMPSVVQARFTTAEAGEATLILTSTVPEAYVYIDWEGNGTPQQFKMIDRTYTIYNVDCHPDTEVKVLGYENEDYIGVFSLSNSKLKEADFSGLTNIYALTLENTGLQLEKLKFPVSKDIVELNLSGNSLDGVNFDYYENLISLSMENCGIGKLDVSRLKNLQRLVLNGNRVKDLKMDNPMMWELALCSNELTDVDLSNVPNLEQLWLFNNKLTSLDVSGLEKLRFLWIYHNYFKLTTLPRVKSSYVSYQYFDQIPWDVVPDGNVVDLSEQLMIGVNRTTYRWFRGDLYYDDYGEIAGDEMTEGVDYTEDNGVFTFLKDQQNARCLLTNIAFPDIVYVTTQINIHTNGVDDVAADKIRMETGEGRIEVSGCQYGASLYTTEGILIRSTDKANVVFDNLAPGAYILRCGKESYKVRVK